MQRGSLAFATGAAKGLTDAAFDMRKKTPDYLKKNLDKPMPFTTAPRAVLVDRASASTASSADGIHAKIRIAPQQAAYLSTLEHGGTKEKHTRGGVGVKSARDRFGNIGRRFRRGAATSQLLTQSVTVPGKSQTRKVKKYFIGKAKGRTHVGLYERTNRNNKLRLVAEYVKKQSYNPTLNLRQEWATTFRRDGVPIVRAAINREIAKASRV